MPSFIEAVRLGVDVIEFDVLTTLDGVVICHHDPLIEETGERPLSVRQYLPNKRALNARRHHTRSADDDPRDGYENEFSPPLLHRFAVLAAWN